MEFADARDTAVPGLLEVGIDLLDDAEHAAVHNEAAKGGGSLKDVNKRLAVGLQVAIKSKRAKMSG